MSALGRTLDPAFDGWHRVVQVGNETASFMLAAGIFALIYKLTPHKHVQWKDVWIGAVFAAGLHLLGRSMIGLYIGHSSVASRLGAAGSLAVVLVWVYYSAQVLLIGAEFTWVYANRVGFRRAAPSLPMVRERGA